MIKTIKRFISLLIIIAIITGLFWLYDFIFVTSPQQVVKNYFSAMNDLRINDAMKMELPEEEKPYGVMSSLIEKAKAFNIQNIAELLPDEGDNTNFIKFKVTPVYQRTSCSFISDPDFSSILASTIPLLSTDAKVKIEFQVISPSGSMIAKESTIIILKKVNNRWKISNEESGNINKYIKQYYSGK